MYITKSQQAQKPLKNINFLSYKKVIFINLLFILSFETVKSGLSNRSYFVSDVQDYYENIIKSHEI